MQGEKIRNNNKKTREMSRKYNIFLCSQLSSLPARWRQSQTITMLIDNKIMQNSFSVLRKEPISVLSSASQIKNYLRSPTRWQFSQSGFVTSFAFAWTERTHSHSRKHQSTHRPPLCFCSKNYIPLVHKSQTPNQRHHFSKNIQIY